MSAVGVRWNVGEARPRAYESLRLSILGAWRLFGPRAAYAVCVNTLSTAEVRRRVGPVPAAVAWVDTTRGWARSFAFAHTGPGRAQNAAWELVPPRLFIDRFEITLDGDVILWEMPSALDAWLAEGSSRSTLLAESHTPSYGAFAGMSGARACSTAIRGVPPGFDLVPAWKGVLRDRPAFLSTAADVQGLQVAAHVRGGDVRQVSVEDIAFHPPALGRCGVRFAGSDVQWDRCRQELYRRVDAGVPLVPVAG
jgi:hypothetical protein